MHPCLLVNRANWQCRQPKRVPSSLRVTRHLHSHRAGVSDCRRHSSGIRRCGHIEPFTQLYVCRVPQFRAVHHSVTGVSHYQRQTSRKLLCCFVSKSVRELLFQFIIYEHLSCLSVIYTVCVALSVDSARSESHAVSHDVFQHPTQIMKCRKTS